MIHVVNKYKHKSIPGTYEFYIGRGSALGNPYTSQKLSSTKAQYQAKDREEAIALYRQWLENKIKEGDYNVQELLYKMATANMQGFDVYLLCFCKPKDCHGDVIKEFVEYMTPEISAKDASI